MNKRISGNALVMKQVNINLVRSVLKSREKATKQQIAKATGLSFVTVGTVLQELIQQHEVIEAELSASEGGRPAQQYRYNADYALALIVFPYETAGQIHLHTDVVNLLGRSVHSIKTSVESVNLNSLEYTVDQMLAAFPSIQAIGFGFPGAEHKGRLMISDYKELLGIPVIEHFQKRCELPVILENDVNAAVIGYCDRKEIESKSTVVYVYFPERHPPGAGMVIRGKLHKGSSNFAGEISRIPLGLSWEDELLQQSFERLVDAISKLSLTISAVLNPDRIVLHGDSITDEHLAAVIQSCRTQLPEGMMPRIERSLNFTGDYLSGMVVLTLETLSSGMAITELK